MSLFRHFHVPSFLKSYIDLRNNITAGYIHGWTYIYLQLQTITLLSSFLNLIGCIYIDNNR